MANEPTGDPPRRGGIHARNCPVIQFVFSVVAALVIVVNSGIDIPRGVIDPPSRRRGTVAPVRGVQEPEPTAPAANGRYRN